MKVRIQKLNDRAEIPKYQTEGAAAFDLVCCLDEYYLPHGVRIAHERAPFMIPTGIAVAIPDGHVGVVSLRSSAGKIGLAIPHGIGVIDSDYRGELFIPVICTNGSWVEIKHGDRIAQMMILPVEVCDLVVVEELPTTQRGDGGFGSTGT